MSLAAAPRVVLRGDRGGVACGQRWFAPVDDVDERLLERCRGPVLDVGCGPGRHTLALAQRGVAALGLDVTDDLLAVARPRGAPVLRRSVFERVPGAGRWATALLLDANLGIGGDLPALLARVRELVRPRGHVLTEPADGPGPGLARIELDGRPGPWFPWVEVGHDELLVTVQASGGFDVVEQWEDGGRTFVALQRTEGA